MQRVEGTSLIEETERPVDVGGGLVRFEVRSFEIVTLRVQFG